MLLRKLLLLAILVLFLGVTSFMPEQTRAFTPCSACYPNYENCVAGCGEDTDCWLWCEKNYRACLNTCTPN
jgi:hypothetical protein